MKSPAFLINAFLSLAVTTFFFGCDDDEPQVDVTITGIAPASAYEGESVTINGTGFSTTTTQNVVSFNGITASVGTASSTQMQVTVPTGATTGKVTVDVNGKAATSSSDFIVKKTSLSDFSPKSGFTGTSVTITGVDFIANPTANEVKFNGAAALVTNATTSRLVVTVPEDATSGKISITTNNKTVISTIDFTVLELTISSVEPASATVGSTVVIKGSNFSTTNDGNVVKFGDVVAEIKSASSTEITVVVPLQAETGKISVSTSGKTAISANDFTVLIPVIDNFSPLTGVSGMEITVNGQNFSSTIGENTVVFVAGDAPAEVLSATQTKLVVMAPREGFNGKISVTVKGKSAVSEQSFVYQTASLTTVFPKPAAPGVTVTLTGSNFSPVAEYNTVTFGGVEAEIVSATPAELKVIIPEGGNGNELRIDSGHGVNISFFDVCGDGIELIPYDVSVSNATNNGETFTLSFKLINAGNESANLANVTVIGSVSDDDIAESADPDLPDSPLSGTLASGDIYEASLIINLPTGISITSHPYLRISTYVTPGTQNECNTGNNVVAYFYE